MTSPFLGVRLGTRVVIILGRGVVAGALLRGSKAEGAGWIAITAGWASKLFVYVTAQTIGAFLGATIVWPHDLPPWAITEDPETKRACFRTDPAIQNTCANWMREIIGTVLLILISALLSRTVGAAGTIPTGLVPDRVGMVV
jgi:glycerol uptake facilitator protein